jgi:hypothetical protein
MGCRQQTKHHEHEARPMSAGRRRRRRSRRSRRSRRMCRRSCWRV